MRIKYDTKSQKQRTKTSSKKQICHKIHPNVTVEHNFNSNSIHKEQLRSDLKQLQKTTNLTHRFNSFNKTQQQQKLTTIGCKG